MRYDHLPLESREGRNIEVEFISNICQVGQQRTIQCNILDNSQRKEAESARLGLEVQREQARKMAAIASLADGIAHEFNNAFTVITGCLDLLELNGFHQKMDEHIQFMKKAAVKMSRLTQQLLSYAGGGQYKLEEVSLFDLVSDSLPLLPSFLKPSIVVETHLSPDLPPILADKGQMQMALLSILANASEAIDKEGVIRITGSKEEMTDERIKAFSGLVPGTYVNLTVSDP